MSVSALRSPRSSMEVLHPHSGAAKGASAALASSISSARAGPMCSVAGASVPAAAPRAAVQQQHHQSRRAPVQPCRSAYASFSSFSSLDSSDSDDESYGPWREKLFVGGVVDYYAVLQVDDDATAEEVKKAYRALAKTCHPDLLGDDGHNICIMLNEAYTVLSDPVARQKYNAQLEQAIKDDEDDFDPTKPLSKWIPTAKPKMAKNTDPNESRAVFVDEFTCIGCKQCIFHACATFRIEPEHGRSRVYAQWLDTEENITAAIDSCPVSCIHWVRKEDLPALEYVMQRRMTQRTNVGVMMAGQGATADVWAATEMFLKERRRLQEAQERASKQRAYSPAQEQARRAAVNAMRKKSLGMFAKFGEMMDNIAEQLQATVSGKPEDMVTVGKRKRTVRWDQVRRSTSPAPGGEDWFMVPPERALVPVSIRSE